MHRCSSGAAGEAVDRFDQGSRSAEVGRPAHYKSQTLRLDLSPGSFFLGRVHQNTGESYMKLVTAIIKPFKLDDVRESLSEIGDAALRFPVFLFRSVERVLECRELPAQRADLLVEDFDLCQRA